MSERIAPQAVGKMFFQVESRIEQRVRVRHLPPASAPAGKTVQTPSPMEKIGEQRVTD
jgi:hypothetical protein